MSRRQQPGQPFDWGEVAPSVQDAEFAADLCRDGVLLGEIQARLLHRGVRPEFVAQIMTDLTADYAAKLFRRGLSASVVTDFLVQQGLSWEDAEAATNAVGRKRSKGRGGLVLLGIGALLVLSGAVIAYGNESGYFPTIPSIQYAIVPVGIGLAMIGGYKL